MSPLPSIPGCCSGHGGASQGAWGRGRTCCWHRLARASCSWRKEIS
jgi:hypothetical protein